MSKEFVISVPLAGYVEVVVEAENEELAKDKAIEDCSNIFTDCSEMEGADHAMVHPYEHIHQGNISYVERNSIEILEVYDCE